MKAKVFSPGARGEQKLTNVSVVRDLMNRHGFGFTKSLGQNFLINPSVCPRMAQSLSPGGVVIEIGAGFGVLTRELCGVARKVYVIELDESLKPVLAETLAGCGNVAILWGDATEVLGSPGFLANSDFSGGVDVCANLPYYAATHIVMKLLESSLPVRTVIAMVQEEVAQRFTAFPGSKQYGIVSVAARYYSEPRTLFRVSRGSFMPAPNVDSAVIRLDVKRERLLPPDREREFFRLVRAAFSERRKQLCNPLSKEYGVDKARIRELLANPNARAEELGLDEFTELFRRVSEFHKEVEL